MVAILASFLYGNLNIHDVEVSSSSCLGFSCNALITFTMVNNAK